MADTIGWALLGVPPVMFPVVAVTGGHWHLLGTAIVSLVGIVVGAGVGVGVNRWRTVRWQERLDRIVVPITLRVCELVADRENRRALHPPASE
ncbi:MAG: hypothetical protein ABI601_19345 [bacterium]